MTPDNLKRKIFDMIKVNGIYERDLFQRLINSYSQKSIEDVIAFLTERGFIKKCGDKVRPIYVRKESAKVVYQHISPLAPGTEQTLLKMHSNFEEERT
jgi:hypothetical protein